MGKNLWIRIIVLFAVAVLIWQFRYASNYTKTNYDLREANERENATTIDIITHLPLQTSFKVYDDAYDFLYGQEFEKALDRAEKAPIKTILYWQRNGVSGALSSDLPRECGGCHVSKDNKLIHDEHTEAVVILYFYPLPQMTRNPNQYWIWRCMEAPPYMMTTNWLNVVDKIEFNMTLTHRADSDILQTYGNSFADTGTKLEDPLANKTKLALIAVSNCNLTPGAIVRMQYLKELLKKGLQLTTTGKCFGDAHISKNDLQEMRKLTAQHKFYFSFENSYHCKDYVTEKFFRAFQAGVVPVVWGARREVYETYIPSSGFIFLEDFPSMQNFIDYLHYLDGNDTAYLEYFRWRVERHHHPRYRHKNEECQICRFLHGINVDDAYKVPYTDLLKNQSFISDRPSRKVAPSIKKQWAEDDDPDCYNHNLQLDGNGRIVVARP